MVTRVQLKDEHVVDPRRPPTIDVDSHQEHEDHEEERASVEPGHVGIIYAHYQGKSMTLRRGKHYSSPFLPATPSSPSLTLEGLFELTQRLLRALDSPRALLLEQQRYKNTVRCASLGAEVSGRRQEQLTHTLIVRLLKPLNFVVPKAGGTDILVQMGEDYEAPGEDDSM